MGIEFVPQPKKIVDSAQKKEREIQFIDTVIKPEEKPSAESAFASITRDDEAISLVRNIDSYDWNSKNIMTQILGVGFSLERKGINKITPEKKCEATLQNLFHTIIASSNPERISDLMISMQDEKIRNILVSKTGKDASQIIQDWLKEEAKNFPDETSVNLISTLNSLKYAYSPVHSFPNVLAEQLLEKENIDSALVLKVMEAFYAHTRSKIKFSTLESLEKKYSNILKQAQKKKLEYDRKLYTSNSEYRKKINEDIAQHIDSFDINSLLRKIEMGELFDLPPSIAPYFLKNSELWLSIRTFDTVPPAYIPTPNILEIIASHFTTLEQAGMVLELSSYNFKKDRTQIQFIEQAVQQNKAIFHSDVLIQILRIDKTAGRKIQIEWGSLFQKEELPDSDLKEEDLKKIEELYPESEGGIQDSFIKQGIVGSCYFLSSLDSIKKNAPDFFRDLVLQNIKSVTITDQKEEEEEKKRGFNLLNLLKLKRKNKETESIEEEMIPQEIPEKETSTEGWEVTFMRGDEQVPIQISKSDLYTWLMKSSGIEAPLGDQVIEAAYSKFRTSQMYQKSISGGKPEHALRHLLGKYAYTGELPTDEREAYKEIKILLEKFIQSPERYALTASVFMGSPIMIQKYGMDHGHGRHAFAIKSYDPSRETITLANPWDSRSKTLEINLFEIWGGEESYSGVFNISFAELKPQASKLGRLMDRVSQKSPEDIQKEIAKIFALSPISNVLSSTKGDINDAENRISYLIESSQSETTRKELQKALYTIQKLQNEESIQEYYKKEANIS